jgi:hypothetical protein
MQDVDSLLKTITVTHRKRRGINGGKFDRNGKKITHRFGKTRRIQRISDLCLICRRKVTHHHYYCNFHHDQLHKGKSR